MKNKLLTFLTAFLITFSFLLVGCQSGQSSSPFIIVSLDSSAISSPSLSVSASSSPSKISFSDKLSSLKAVFGTETYELYNVTISGIAFLDNIIISAIPTNENGETINASQTDQIAYYTDYFSLKFKITSNIKTISIGEPDNSISINKNRLIDNYYLLNLKWLKLSKNKETATIFDYGNSNYMLIETKDANNQTLEKFMLHLTFDITFI
ncbi:MAG: hypothetical protein J5689_01525 [Clostridia bacterium]|nr:hypothetical protein [Clostridia bacterium]